MAATPSIPEMLRVKATAVTAPPSWAVLQRKLIDLMERAVPIMSRKYADRGGTWYWSDDMDDDYERSYNWCLLYAIGGGQHLVDLALKHWNATTRLFDDRDGNRANHRDYYYGIAPKQLKYSIHNEYFSLAHPGDAEWHHMGEGNMASYAFGEHQFTEGEIRRAGCADQLEVLRGPTAADEPHPGGGGAAALRQRPQLCFSLALRIAGYTYYSPLAAPWKVWCGSISEAHQRTSVQALSPEPLKPPFAAPGDFRVRPQNV